jgi:hypothetical protein
MPLLLELLHHLSVVVDFTIEDHPDGAIFIVDGLMPTSQVNNAQAAHADSQVAIYQGAFIIRPAMLDDVQHIGKNGWFGCVVMLILVDTANTAH